MVFGLAHNVFALFLIVVFFVFGDLALPVPNLNEEFDGKKVTFKTHKEIQIK